MKKTLFFSLFLPASLFAGGMQLIEVGTPGMGFAGVGQAAIANDASTAYFNPAGMAFLPCNEVLLGGQLMVTDLPLDQQYRIGAGILYEWDRCTTVGTAFEFLNFGKNKMENPIVQGHYPANNAYFFNVTFARRF